MSVGRMSEVNSLAGILRAKFLFNGIKFNVEVTDAGCWLHALT